MYENPIGTCSRQASIGIADFCLCEPEGVTRYQTTMDLQDFVTIVNGAVEIAIREDDPPVLPVACATAAITAPANGDTTIALNGLTSSKIQCGL